MEKLLTHVGHFGDHDHTSVASLRRCPTSNGIGAPLHRNTHLALEFEGSILNSNRITVSVFTDAADVPGTLLGAWTTSVLTTSDDNLFPTTISGIGGITLTQGASYFLQASPVDATTEVGWSQNAAMLTGEVYDPPEGSTTAYLPAFDVLGTPVPEPPSSVLSGAIVLGLLFCGRVTHNGNRGHKRNLPRGDNSRN